MEIKDIENYKNIITKASKDLPNLEREAKSELIDEISSVLKKLATWKATADVLRSTQIGSLVNGLRKNKNLDPETANLAVSVVLQWKKDVTQAADQQRKRPREGEENDSNKKTKTNVSSLNTSPKTTSDLNSPCPASAEYATERTAESDDVECQVTDDKIRNNCIKMLYKGLASYTSEPSKAVLGKAIGTEQKVFEVYNSVTDKYKTRIRSMYLNLMDKNNSTLRFKVLSGEISEERFATMAKEQMASEDVRAKAARANEDNLSKAIAAVNNEAETDMFKCGKCGQRKTKYYQMQTRSADEPMTTFVTCINCGNRWKFC